MQQEKKAGLRPGQRFWRLLKPNRKDIRNVYFYAVFSGITSLSLPLGVQAIINLIQGGRISTSWVVLVVLVILGVAITGILQISQLRITENLQQKIFARAAFEFAYRIPRIKMELLYKHYAPELMNRFFDIIAVQKGLSKILIDFSTAALHIIFGLILLSFYHSFFIIFGLILILAIFVVFRFISKSAMRTSLQESKYKYKLVHWLEELARTNTTFKLAGKTDLPLDKTDEYVDEYLKSRESHFRILIGQYSLLVFFKVLLVTGLLAIGGVLVMEQHMNIGQFVAAEIIILLVIASIEKLITSIETIYDVLTALEKIGQVTDLELDKDEGLILDLSGVSNGIEVELNDVTFAYPDQTEPVLSNLSIQVEAGQSVVITGASGSGKSTVLQLMAALYAPQHGNLSYHGLAERSIKSSSLKAIMGDCLSQEQLFEGTILENITMGRANTSFENVQWAVKNLGLSSFIKNLPEGYNTIVNPEGRQLPRNIIQRMLIARSVAHKPKLLLLENIVVNLEQKMKIEVIDFLTAEENKWTLIAVSADPYFASKAMVVIELKEGKLLKTTTNHQAQKGLHKEK